MVLRRPDIAAFVANWQDKATNIRAIAEQLNLGLDALVFVDDNPFERALVRQELPMVSVPELPEDPADYVATVAAAGYFEATGVTEDDRKRSEQYQANAARQAAKSNATDLPAYLRSLEMKLIWRNFDRVGLTRIVQLINKTNQFNLTTRRRTATEVEEFAAAAGGQAVVVRVRDRFGDAGVVGLALARRQGDDCVIDSLLLSCRVIGRGIESVLLAHVSEEAARAGAKRLVGEYIATKKNAPCAEFYSDHGFTRIVPSEGVSSGPVFYELDLTASTITSPKWITLEGNER
jgi:FkbH-like protein